MKEASTARGRENGVNGRCANCLDDQEHTLHLMYECPTAAQLLDEVYRSFNLVLPPLVGNDGFPLVMSIDQVIFFHLPPELPSDVKQDINDVLMIVKHSLYRLRMRDDQDVVPSLFDSLLHVTIELGKLSHCRFAKAMDYRIIDSIKSKLESVMGLNP